MLIGKLLWIIVFGAIVYYTNSGLFIFLACLPIIMFVGYIGYLYIEEAIDKRIERKRINKINDNRQKRSIK